MLSVAWLLLFAIPYLGDLKIDSGLKIGRESNIKGKLFEYVESTAPY